MSDKSKELLKTLLREKFDKYPNAWQVNEAKEVIETARELGFVELVKDMENDL